MDAKQFDDLVARLAAGPSRRQAVAAFLASAVASAGLPAMTEAKKRKQRRKSRDRKGKAQSDGRDQKGRVSAEGKKKKFCLCPGSVAANCTQSNCVNCVSQGKIGKKKRQQIKAENPLSFRGDCPPPPPTTTTSTTTTTTQRVCGGRCQVGTNTCGQISRNCECRGSSVIPGSDGTCTTNAGTCSGQTCTSGATNQCAGLGGNCVCNSSGPPGSTGTCGRPTTTTSTTTTTSGEPTTTTSGGPTTTTTTSEPVICGGLCSVSANNCPAGCVCSPLIIGGDAGRCTAL